jgi:predicted nucleotidyltransferase
MPYKTMEMNEDEQRTFFKEVDRFVRNHLKYKYPLTMHYSIAKQTIQILTKSSEGIKAKYPGFVGISIYGSRARGYARLGEEDFDLIVLHNGMDAKKLRQLLNELRTNISRLGGKPCEAGTDTYDIASMELNQYQRMRKRFQIEEEQRRIGINTDGNFDPFFLFHVLPVIGTKEIIEARKRYLEKVVSDEKYRKEWDRIVKRLQAKERFSRKAVARIFALAKVTHGNPIPYPEEEPTWITDLPLETKRILLKGQKIIENMVAKKNERTGFHTDPQKELSNTKKWLERRKRRARK